MREAQVTAVYLVLVGSVPVRVFQSRESAEAFKKGQQVAAILELTFQGE